MTQPTLPFTLSDARAVLERTPATLRTLLQDLPDAWIHATEGPETWSPFDIVGHLIHGERADWIPRAQLILSQGTTQPFPPFDRFAQFEASKGKTLDDLLDTFAALRSQSLLTLRKLSLTDDDFALKGLHPELGEVTLGQLLATWAAHDLSHIAQICRVMAKQYAEAVGPWRAYLPLLDR